jgi:hypothetical protein
MTLDKHCQMYQDVAQSTVQDKMRRCHSGAVQFWGWWCCAVQVKRLGTHRFPTLAWIVGRTWSGLLHDNVNPLNTADDKVYTDVEVIATTKP